jgi:hypothetical protein
LRPFALLINYSDLSKKKNNLLMMLGKIVRKEIVQEEESPLLVVSVRRMTGVAILSFNLFVPLGASV